MCEPALEFQSLLERRRYSQRTIEAYVFWLRELGRHFPEKSVSTLSSQDVQSFLGNLKDRRRLSNASLRQARCAIDLYFKEVGGTDHNISSFARGWVKRAKPVIPTQAQVLTVFDNVTNEDYRAALICIYGMGLELNEALRIKIRNVDLKRGLVEIPLLRRRGQRQAILPKALFGHLDRLMLNKQPDDNLFTSRTGGPCTEKSLQRALTKARAQSGVSVDFNIRSLRHAYIKHLEFLGIPLFRIIDHMGLSRGTSFDFYSTVGYPDVDVTFSPMDRRISEVEESHVRDVNPYISEQRIDQLSALFPKEFDLGRLLALLRELNVAYKTNSFMAVAMLVRSVIDHIPPILGFRTFNEVVSNYPGTKSFRKSMEHLNLSLRNIADAHLHVPIRKSEALPTFQQVDFRADIDTLLGELARVLKHS